MNPSSTDSTKTRRFLNKKQSHIRLNVSERTFDLMRSQGLLPDPFEFGPRAFRWDEDELVNAAASLPRVRRAEPVQLAATRQVTTTGG